MVYPLWLARLLHHAPLLALVLLSSIAALPMGAPGSGWLVEWAVRGLLRDSMLAVGSAALAAVLPAGLGAVRAAASGE